MSTPENYTVGELIEALKGYDESTPVAVIVFDTEDQSECGKVFDLRLEMYYPQGDEPRFLAVAGYEKRDSDEDYEEE